MKLIQEAADLGWDYFTNHRYLHIIDRFRLYRNGILLEFSSDTLSLILMI